MDRYDEETKQSYIALFLYYVRALWNRTYLNNIQHNATSTYSNLKDNNLDTDIQKWLGDQLFGAKEFAIYLSSHILSERKQSINYHRKSHEQYS